MLEKVMSAMLISDVPSFAEHYKALAESVGVDFRAENEWNERYRMSSEVVILGSKYLDKLNKAYYKDAVLILKEEESPAPYIKKGIERFIFNFRNNYELLCAFYKKEKTFIHTDSKDLETVIKNSNSVRYCIGNYDFEFDKNRFRYKERYVYFPDSVKKYLAEWLLNGHKDNKKRMILCNLRKKFGEGFLKDVDRFGQLKGGENEQ